MSYENPYFNYAPQPNINPYGYQNMQPQNVNQPTRGNYIWVNSRKEAEEFPLGANGSQMMMNRNEKAFYLKTCDGFGMTNSFREFVYSERTDIPENTMPENRSTVEYVSREEFAELKAEIEALKSANKRQKGKEDNAT